MKLILPEQITKAQYKAYLADWGAERIVPSERHKGSAKTIENAGGVLENKVEKDGVLMRRYWVSCADDFERKK